MEKEN